MHKIEINGLQCDLVSLNNNDPEGFKYLEVDGVLVYTRIDAPVITTQPVNSPDVFQGENYSFTVVASTGDGTLSYQWFYGESGDESNPQAGETNSTLSKSTNDVGVHKYWCKVSNERFSVNSVTVQVNVKKSGIIFDITVGHKGISTPIAMDLYGFSAADGEFVGALDGQNTPQGFELDGKTLYLCSVAGAKANILGSENHIMLNSFWTTANPPDGVLDNITGHTHFQIIFPDKTFDIYWNEKSLVGTPEWSLVSTPETTGLENKPFTDYLESKVGQTLRTEFKFL